LEEDRKIQVGTSVRAEGSTGADILRRIADDLRLLIELSVEEPDGYLDKWLDHFRSRSPVNCWEKKGCGKDDCPAFGKEDVRCWLVAGTMCGGEVRGEFAKKFEDCTKCDVYQEAVFKDAITEIYEHLLTLTTTLRQNMKKLRTMAVRDPLTGLYNRHYFNETISHEIKTAERHGRELSVIVVDINNFKKINDTYGHLHGDGVLTECARILTDVARESDIVCRFGGDEFIIVTPEVGCDDAHPLTDRIEKELDRWNELYGSDDYELSFSFGCANFIHGSEFHDVIREADQMMYKDKQKRTRTNGKPL
jgi:diguanylate cyclase (GGDEF)-like protein